MPGIAGADEDMHRMEMCVGWIYEFFSRHRLEEAKKGAPMCGMCTRWCEFSGLCPSRAGLMRARSGREQSA